MDSIFIFIMIMCIYIYIYIYIYIICHHACMHTTRTRTCTNNYNSAVAIARKNQSRNIVAEDQADPEATAAETTWRHPARPQMTARTSLVRGQRRDFLPQTRA
jgi:hypothetical protein